MNQTDRKSDVTLFDIFARLAEKDDFNTVRIGAGAREIEIDLFNGRVVDYRDVELGDFFVVDKLVEIGLISGRKAEKTKKYIVRKKTGQIAALSRKCGVSAEVACRIAEQFVKERILDLFLRKDLKFVLAGGKPKFADFLRTPIPVSFLLKEAKRRRSELPRILDKVNENTILKKSMPPPHLASGESLLWEDLPLNPFERRLYLFIDGVLPLRELCAKTGLGDFETMRAAYSLVERKFVEKVDLLNTLAAVKKPNYFKYIWQGSMYALLLFLFALMFGRFEGMVEAAVTGFADEKFKGGVGMIKKAFLIEKLDAFYLLNGEYPENLGMLKTSGFSSGDDSSGVLTYRSFGNGFVINWR